MKEFSLQALDFDRSVCMAAICYRDQILTMSSDITLLPYIMIHSKFREDISSNEKVFHTST